MQKGFSNSYLTSTLRAIVIKYSLFKEVMMSNTLMMQACRGGAMFGLGCAVSLHTLPKITQRVKGCVVQIKDALGRYSVEYREKIDLPTAEERALFLGKQWKALSILTFNALKRIAVKVGAVLLLRDLLFSKETTFSQVLRKVSITTAMYYVLPTILRRIKGEIKEIKLLPPYAGKVSLGRKSDEIQEGELIPKLHYVETLAEGLNSPESYEFVNEWKSITGLAYEVVCVAGSALAIGACIGYGAYRISPKSALTSILKDMGTP